MFIQKAQRGANDLHWYILTIVLVFLGLLIIGQIPVTAALFYYGAEAGMDTSEILENAGENNLGAFNINKNLFLILILFSFAVAYLFLRFCVRKFHKKSISDISTGRTSWDWGRIKFGFGAWAVLLVLSESLGYFLEPENHILQFDLSKFIPLVIIAFLFIPIQTTFEELFTRGYLLQGLALVFKNRWAPWIITSLFFGTLHMANPEVMEYGWQIMLLNYAGTGLLLGALALMDDGLELAIGMHAANNIFASLFVTFEDSALQTDAIFMLKELDIYAATVVGIVMSVIYFFICKYKYGWTDWSKLYGKVEFSSDPAVDTEFVARNTDQNKEEI